MADRRAVVGAHLRAALTDDDLPLRQGPWRSPLRDERVAAMLGVALGVAFTTCALTGLHSHLHQHL